MKINIKVLTVLLGWISLSSLLTWLLSQMAITFGKDGITPIDGLYEFLIYFNNDLLFVFGVLLFFGFLICKYYSDKREI